MLHVVTQVPLNCLIIVEVVQQKLLFQALKLFLHIVQVLVKIMLRYLRLTQTDLFCAVDYWLVCTSVVDFVACHFVYIDRNLFKSSYDDCFFLPSSSTDCHLRR